MIWNNLELPDKYYYQDDWVTIYHGDCREILPDLPKVDLVLTDPPYGMNYLSNHYKYGNPHSAIIGDDEYPVDILNKCIELANNGVWFFCRWETLPFIPKPKSFIVWVKNNWTAGDLNHEYGRSWEGIAFYPCDKHQFYTRPHDTVIYTRVPSTNLHHPTEKPIFLLQDILQHNIGDVVLDPFIGSGSTLIASKALNRKSIGIEIDEKYCEIAVKRCRQQIAEMDASDYTPMEQDEKGIPMWMLG